MSNNENSTNKLLFNANSSHSPSRTPTSSSPVTINGNESSTMINSTNGLLNENKFSTNHFHQNGGTLADLQSTFQTSPWGHVLDSLATSNSGDHPFDIPHAARLFSPQSNPTTSSPPPLMAMQQQQQQQQIYQQVTNERIEVRAFNASFFSLSSLGNTKTTDHRFT